MRSRNRSDSKVQGWVIAGGGGLRSDEERPGSVGWLLAETVVLTVGLIALFKGVRRSGYCPKRSAAKADIEKSYWP